MLGGVMGSRSRSIQRSRQYEPVVHDTYPTAMHIACAEEIQHRLLPR